MRGVLNAALLLGLLGCAPGDFSYSKKIDGPYRVMAVDDLASMSLCYEVADGCYERVGPTVTAVGWNAAYIVVARTAGANSDASEYFYINRAADRPDLTPPAEVLAGPFSADQFAVDRGRLGLPPLMRDVPFIYCSDKPRCATWRDIIR